MRIITLLLLWTVSPLSAQVTRVLFIGNSYTYSNDLPGLFTQLAGSLGNTVETAMVAPGGFTFEGHTTNPASQNAIAQGDWDVVVLQSLLPASASGPRGLSIRRTTRTADRSGQPLCAVRVPDDLGPGER